MATFMRLVTVATFLTLLRSSYAGYTLQDDYSGANFFGMFDFFTAGDPTQGYVDYISQSDAQSAGLIDTSNGQIRMSVDSKNVASGRGRKSVRLTSKAKYNHGLIVLDLEHMPGSICGTWPAFWTVGPNWPNSGEIDIIEGVNTQSNNAMTLHTGPGCSIGPHANQSPKTGSSDANSNAVGAPFSGSISTSNCDVNAAGQAMNAGCGIATSDKSSYGNGLNAINGGVYATEWTSDVIRIWFFPRSSIPSDLGSTPDPSSWGMPLASFPGTSCNIDANFKDHQIVFDTTFCGAWAGTVWSQDPTCSAKAPTCQEFVQNHPEAFAEAFWTINSLKVFTSDGKVSISSSNDGGDTSSSAHHGISNGGHPTATQASAESSPVLSITPTPLPDKPSSPSEPSPSNTEVAPPWPNTSPDGWQHHTHDDWSRGAHRGRTREARDLISLDSAVPVPTSMPENSTGTEEEAAMRVVVDDLEQAAENIDLRAVRRHMARHRRRESRSRLGDGW